MRVLVLTNLGWGFSATKAERTLFTGLRNLGVEITVSTSGINDETRELEAAGVRIADIAIRQKIDINAIRKIRSLIRDEKFDLIYMTSSKAVSNAILAAGKNGPKLVAYIGSTSVHWHDPTAWISFLHPSLDRIVCLSNGVKEHMIRQCPRRMREKSVRIYKGYEPEWVNDVVPIERRELGIPEDAFIICSVANVRRIKGIHYLIDSANLLPDGLPVYFLLLGYGMDGRYISRLIGRSKYRDNFRVSTFTPRVLSYTAACDLYIQPSISEGLGRSVIEAMCLGKPVIASGRGGVGELIDEGNNGWHLPSKSPEAIARQIEFCLSNRDLLPSIGANGRERIRTDFNSSRMISETFHLFRSIVSRQ